MITIPSYSTEADRLSLAGVQVVDEVEQAKVGEGGQVDESTICHNNSSRVIMPVLIYRTTSRA